MFIIVEGTVAIERQYRKTAKSWANLRAYDFFGELTVRLHSELARRYKRFQGIPCQRSAYPYTDCDLAFLNTHDVYELRKESETIDDCLNRFAREILEQQPALDEEATLSTETHDLRALFDASSPDAGGMLNQEQATALLATVREFDMAVFQGTADEVAQTLCGEESSGTVSWRKVATFVQDTQAANSPRASIQDDIAGLTKMAGQLVDGIEKIKRRLAE